ncbi:16S rRNA (guanine(527)-N(7))-methyltransferase RsmG [Chelativorans sp. AA-79]|uniref:16S rRNA (guanine(527)-N(7))-methyltransferase RsmG n=1 Tax=Chelativorans sp. AA-79 TaxID=3028735 RepID=UPI0023F80F53|nr:16S rRNA (guanine(527)-N(7))-methyltransferase RsmG [Chelativorans sp. AA-79]WEX09617.1 16S rRNA (guanine(527)-N(7))-methyltransferase RsmG [Chelativorans sp. AA-79]
MTGGRFLALEKVAGSVSRETFERIECFEAAFVRWSARINLAAPSSLPHLWERHILDSAQLPRLAPNARYWLDLGSGGGFPGAIVAIMIAGREGGHVDLIESNRKKAAFLQTVLASLDAPASVHARRVEKCFGHLETPDIITARALAPLPVLLELAASWMSEGARALFHKGRDYRREVEESRDAWGFDLIEHRNKVGGDGVILDISNLRRL